MTNVRSDDGGDESDWNGSRRPRRHHVEYAHGRDSGCDSEGCLPEDRDHWKESYISASDDVEEFSDTFVRKDERASTQDKSPFEAVLSYYVLEDGKL